MKTFLLSSLLFFVTSLTFSNQPAPLGKFLSKRITSLQDDDQTLVLISFTDKGNTQKYKSVRAQTFLSEHAIKRRLKVRTQSTLIDASDYPLEQRYVQAITGKVTSFRHELKWFNAVSAIATKKQIEDIRNLPFVRQIEIVGTWSINRSLENEIPEQDVPAPLTLSKTTALDYGPALKQLSQMNVPAVHNLGIYGQGVVIGVIDNGFRLLTHQAFSTMNIIAQHDFVDHKTSVIPNNPSTGFGAHGINTLSTIGGYMPGQLIGPAFKASFVLARTENDSSEKPIEEDNWAKAIEWADSVGVDVTSTSLGYLDYDPTGAGGPDWTWQNMDGNTTLITRAADRAVGLGIIVVNSAGNEASRGTPNTLGAPADGDSVISAGAVDSLGNRASFSSYGPTFDGRTKPDIMAMGVAVRVASATSTTGYSRASGTSFSCPLSAGVAALILCANPSLTPMQVREAMRQTANNSGSPNNLYGWGIINALAAINYYGITPFARISGTIFLDSNSDGIKDSGEPGITGVTIRLSGLSTDSTITNELGDYTFDSLAIGSYTVSEDAPAGWNQSSPLSGTHTVSIDSATANISGKDFGIFQPAAIHGTTFEDVDGNGIKDLNEPVLSGWKIILTGPSPMSTYTDAQGDYSFLNLNPGTYTLSESLQSGWMQSVPVSVYSLSLQSGMDTSGLKFGNYRPIAIHGTKFNDINENAIWDNLDTGLVNWTIHLTGTATASAVTDTGGHYSFTNLKPGSYIVSEQHQGGWIQTLPVNDGSYSFTATSGLDTNGLDFGNHFSPNISYPVASGWNLLSLPLIMSDNYYGSLYPSASSKPFIYDHGYNSIDTIPNGVGYWIKFPYGQNVLFNGDVRTVDTLNLTPGWHMIGTPTYPVAFANITQQPDTLVSSNFYYYDGGYFPAIDSLYPHKGYWVKTKTSGNLIFTTTIQKNHLPASFGTDKILENFNRITVRDQMGTSQTLYFDNDKQLLPPPELFELPPPAPGNGLDVRFSGGSFAAISSDNESFEIRLRGGVYPLTISWNIGEKSGGYSLSSEKIHGVSWSQKLRNTGTATLDNPAITVLHLQLENAQHPPPLPTAFELDANFPNPFNPSTTISYALPTDAIVNIRIFNLLGQHIASLASKTQSAGRYSITWDATSSAKMELPGGIYLYRLDAYPINGEKPYSKMRKMILLK